MNSAQSGDFSEHASSIDFGVCASWDATHGMESVNMARWKTKSPSARGNGGGQRAGVKGRGPSAETDLGPTLSSRKAHTATC